LENTTTVLLVSDCQKSLIEVDKPFASSSTYVLIWICIGGYTPILVNKLKKLKTESSCERREHPCMRRRRRSPDLESIKLSPSPPEEEHLCHRTLDLQRRGTLRNHQRRCHPVGPPPSRYGLRGPSRAPTADPSLLGEAHVAPAHTPIAANRKAQCGPAHGPTTTARRARATPVHVPTLMPAPPPWALHRQESLDVRELERDD
jgi:hypothetical protein